VRKAPFSPPTLARRAYISFGRWPPRFPNHSATSRTPSSIPARRAPIMTVIQAAPRVPKPLYRPAEVQPPLEERAGVYLPEYEQDPYIHPAYAKAYRRPPSPIAEGRFVPDRDSTPVRRSRSTSTRRTPSSSGSRSKSVPAQPEAPLIIPDRALESSPHSLADPPSERSSRRSSPRSIASSAPLETPPSESPVFPAAPTLVPEDTPPATSAPVPARPSKLRKPRRSTETVGQSVKSQERELRVASPVVEPPTSRPQSAKSRSAFSRFRFGKATAGRSPPQTIAQGDGSRRLSKASSYVVVDAPEESIAEVPLDEYSQAAPGPQGLVRDSAYLSSPYPRAPSIQSWESGSHAGQALMPPAIAVNLDQIDELDETDPGGYAWHMPGPYDVVRSTVGSRVGGSVVGGSQVGSQVAPGRRHQVCMRCCSWSNVRSSFHRFRLPPPSLAPACVTVTVCSMPTSGRLALQTRPRLHHHIRRTWRSFPRRCHPLRPKRTRMSLTLVLDHLVPITVPVDRPASRFCPSLWRPRAAKVRGVTVLGMVTTKGHSSHTPMSTGKPQQGRRRPTAISTPNLTTVSMIFLSTAGAPTTITMTSTTLRALRGIPTTTATRHAIVSGPTPRPPCILGALAARV
jgi:hypothetical protein